MLTDDDDLSKKETQIQRENRPIKISAFSGKKIISPFFCLGEKKSENSHE